MRKTYSQIVIIALLLTVFNSHTNASIEINWYEGNYTIPYLGWSGADMINIYNDVTVTMPGGGGVGGQFNMFDNSALFMYKDSIGELNLYDNASAELFSGIINNLYIDSASTAQVTLYARDVVFWPDTPPPQQVTRVLCGDIG